MQIKIHRMDKICLKLAMFEEFATTVLQTVAKRCFSFQQTSGLNYNNEQKKMMISSGR